MALLFVGHRVCTREATGLMCDGSASQQTQRTRCLYPDLLRIRCKSCHLQLSNQPPSDVFLWHSCFRWETMAFSAPLEKLWSPLLTGLATLPKDVVRGSLLFSWKSFLFAAFLARPAACRSLSTWNVPWAFLSGFLGAGKHVCVPISRILTCSCLCEM